MSVSFLRELEVRYNVDVMVAGGGPAGVAAAISASKQGANVLLIESAANLGGSGTTGLVPVFMDFTNGVDFLADGVGRQVLERMWKIGGKIADHPSNIKVEALKLAYDELIAEAGASCLLMTRVIGLEANDGIVSYAVCSGKSGLFAVQAKVFVDATGDGDLCAWAGAPYEKGDEEGHMMAGTLCTLWSGIDWSKVIKPDARELERAFSDKVFTFEDRHLPGMSNAGGMMGGGNIGHVFGVDGTDEESLTKALIWGRKSLREYEKYYKEYLVSGYQDIELVMTGAALGIRETRRILGDYVMTLNDYVSRACFEDEIGRYSFTIDIHASDSSKKSHQKSEKNYYDYGYKKGESYGIPYRSLCPKGIHNVLVAGRCISADRYIQSSIRVMPGCFITGQAAGVAAALATEYGNNIRNFSVLELQHKLKAMGAFLPNTK